MNAHFLFDTRLLLLRARRRVFLRLVMWVVLVVAAVAVMAYLALFLIDSPSVGNALVRALFPPVILRG